MLNDTVTFDGGVGVTTTVSNNQVSFAIGQDVATTADVQSINVTVDGTLTSDDITSTNISIAGNATITRRSYSTGTTTTINATQLDVADIITVASGAANAAQADGAGLTIAGASTLTYDATNDRFAMNKDLATDPIGDVTGNADTATAQETARNFSASGDATAPVSYDATGDVDLVLTLANSGVTAGSTAVEVKYQQ